MLMVKKLKKSLEKRMNLTGLLHLVPQANRLMRRFPSNAFQDIQIHVCVAITLHMLTENVLLQKHKVYE